MVHSLIHSKTNQVKRILLILSGLVLLVGIAQHYFLSIDYYAWRSDWRIFTKWLTRPTESPRLSTSKFPPAYLLASAISSESTSALLYSNFFFLLIPVLLLICGVGISEFSKIGLIFITVLVASPLPQFYLNSGGLELQSGIWIGLFIFSYSRLINEDFRKNSTAQILLLFLSGIVVPMYKDILVPLVVISMIFTEGARHFCTRHSTSSLQPFNTAFLRLALGSTPLLLGQVIGCWYNFARYGSIFPEAYILEATTIIPSFGDRLSHLLWIIFSPNGGLLIFWALPTSLLLLGIKKSRYCFNSSTTVFSFSFLVLLLLTTANWWVPFGWDSWGNRLIIPGMLAFIVSSILTLEPQQSEKPYSRAYFLALPWIIGSGYYLLYPLIVGQDQALYESLWSGPHCSKLRAALISSTGGDTFPLWSTELYRSCSRERYLHISGL